MIIPDICTRPCWWRLYCFVRRAAATAVMWSLVAPGGALVLVDEGSAKGSHTVRSARQMVLRHPPTPSPSEPGEYGTSLCTPCHVSQSCLSGCARGVAHPFRVDQTRQRSKEGDTFAREDGRWSTLALIFLVRLRGDGMLCDLIGRPASPCDWAFLAVPLSGCPAPLCAAV